MQTHRPSLVRRQSSLPVISTLALVAALASGCGGSGDEPPQLSSTQAAFETFALASNGGLHDMLWSLPAGGTPSSSAGHFIVDIASAGLAESPLTGGAQTQTASWTSLSTALAVPAAPVNVAAPTLSGASTAGPSVRLPTFVVKGGRLLEVASVSPTTLETVSYAGSNVQIDTLATDGTTVAYSTLVTAFVTKPVAGQPIAAPTDSTIAAWLARYNLIADAAAILKPGATFAPDSAYALLTSTRKGDVLFVDDCTFAAQSTTAAAVVPCQAGRIGAPGLTSLSTFFDGTGGASKTWTFATDGSVCEVAAQAAGSGCPPFGARYWVAATPLSANVNVPRATTTYRAYVELNGAVYVAQLQRDGAAVGQNLGSDAAPSIIGQTVRVNRAFVQSIQAALVTTTPPATGTALGCFTRSLALTRGDVFHIATTSTSVSGATTITATAETITTVMGATTFNGHAVIERDSINFEQGVQTSTAKEYLAQVTPGRFTRYGNVTVDSRGTLTATITPPVEETLMDAAVGVPLTGTVTTVSVFVSTTGLRQTTTVSATSTATFDGRETITVPAGTYNTCKFTTTSAGPIPLAVTTWAVEGFGVAAKVVVSIGGGATTTEATSIKVNGARI